MQALGPDNIDRSPSKPKLTNNANGAGLYKSAAGLSARPVNTQMLAKMKDLGVDKEIPLKKLQVERLVSVLSTMSRWFRSTFVYLPLFPMPLGHFLRFRKWPGARLALFSAYRRARSVAEGSSASLIQSSKISERSLSSAKTCLEVFSGQCIFSCAESKSRSALNLSESESWSLVTIVTLCPIVWRAVARSESLVPAPTRSWMTLLGTRPSIL